MHVVYSHCSQERYFANATGGPLQMNDVFVHCPITPSTMEILVHIYKEPSDQVSFHLMGKISFIVHNTYLRPS